MASNETIEGLEQWDVEIREVSAGWYLTRTVRNTGNLFEECGNDPDGLSKGYESLNLASRRNWKHEELEARS
jgi:hypothetical protein